MAKYKGQNRIDDDERSYAEQFRDEVGEPVQTKAPEADDGGYKKRYGDLRRHTQQQLAQKEAEIAEIKAQLEQAAKGQIRFPKTDEEIDAWAKKYPDVAQIVDTIAAKRASEAMEGLKEGEKRLNALETKLTKREAEAQLMRLHPDFSRIRQDPKFHEWVAMQPLYIRDALYKNNTDAQAAARAIDLYKADRGIRKNSPKSAAASVGKTSSSRPAPKGKMTYRESQVAAMSQQEYEKHEDAIMQAMRDNKFEYDLSGGAR